ncbi:MAG: FKBP-type peptidyl-prolyl cis-trans isomerase N-terminal domain-containing protein [Gammaproteobacteria bacterium]
MKKCTVFLLALGLADVGVAEEAVLNTKNAKFSYAIGLQIGQSLVRQGVEIDTQAFALALQDALAGREPRLPAAELQAVMQKQEKEIQKRQQAVAEKNLAAGRRFLEENKSKEGIQELPNGLQYKVIKEGKGNRPQGSDSVDVHYRGTLIDGREFDSSYRRGEPATLHLNGVIKGWQEALPMMPEGSKWQIFLPPELAYGRGGAGAVIGPNETLIFEIELIAVHEAKTGGK